MQAKFILFAQGRTGSTLLGDLLRSHPAIFFGDEILSTKVTSPRWTAERLRLRHARHAVGFHVKIYQLTDDQGVADPGAWLRGMHGRGWRVISLRRENLLRHVLSNMTAQAANRYEERAGSTDRVRIRPHVDPSELMHWMGVRASVGAREAAALDGVGHLSLTYEEHLADPDSWRGTMQQVFTHLDLSPVDVATTLIRQNPGRLDELIANYDEVAAAIRDTEYAPYLD
jgi:LPS sulfotransferase NodH